MRQVDVPGSRRAGLEFVVLVTEPLDHRGDRWHRLIGDAAELRPARLVLDLTGCPSIDAAAIALLLRVHRDLMTEDGRLVLRGPGPRVLRLLALAQVDGVFDVEPGTNEQA